MSHRMNRRTFIRQVGYAGATLPIVLPPLLRAQPANNKLNCAFVAVEGRAGAHTGEMHKMGENCVAFAEIDKNRWGGVKNKDGWGNAAGYTDWRKMFEKHEKEIDVVFVTTPDHTHFGPSMTAVSLGKHCYTEKPLTWSVEEANLLTRAYEKNPKVVTQMGNQGHSGNGWRLAAEFIEQGAIGDILEFHTWTNRPVWPQGGGRPQGEDPVPAHIDWDAWVGPAPMRPYKHDTYHAFKWRGFWDFGAGALGDMACHTTDGMHTIMKPDWPTVVEPLFLTGPVNDMFPSGSIIRWEYPAKDGKPAFKAFWYEGKGPDGGDNMPPTPEELTVDNRKLPRTGNLIIGTKGKMLVQGDYWDSPQIIPKAKSDEFGRPKETIPRSPGHHREFVMACKGEKPREFSQSNWTHAGPMTAKIQLGNIAMKVGKRLEITRDGKVSNDAEANALLWREPRQGWGPLEQKV